MARRAWLLPPGSPRRFRYSDSFIALVTDIGQGHVLASRTVVWLRYHNEVQQFDRITMDPEVMGGKPCIRGMRVTVGMIVEAMAAGRTIEQLLADFPYLEEPDIREALAFAAHLAQGHEIRLAS